ncbi:hypothetical protein MMC27_002384 [Xylographa pallens]|nr:hypothetical protein [Xylographa pallens]
MTQRPPLKLKLTTSGNPSGRSSSPHPLATPSSASSMPKLKIRFGSSAISSDPAASVATAGSPVLDKKELKSSLKKVKKEKPPRLSTGKKRDQMTANIDEDAIEVLPFSSPAPLTGSSSKRIKLITKTPLTKTPTTPYIRLKPKGKPPKRPLGVGYDSEASDREEDPAIEEEFILRMLPGEDCEFLRKVIEEKRWGPKSQGGADVKLKFLSNNGRRAALTIRGQIYAAALVDLPCVIEGMKSWDKRGWWKTADICQMLLVLGTVNTETEALNYTLPGRELDKTTWQYAHGLTPPMRWVRKRRFRKRVSNRTIEAVEDEVERLLRLDEESIGESKYENLDLDRLSKTRSGRGESADEIGGESVYDEQDAIGEIDDGGGYFDQEVNQEELDDDGLAADLELAMMASDADDTASAATPSNAVALDIQQQTDSEAGTPAANTPSRDDSGDDESDEEADAEEEVDEDVLEQQADLQRQREEIADLEAAIKSQTAEYERQPNIILKKKILGKIQSLKGDLELKLAAIGEGGDD